MSNDPIQMAIDALVEALREMYTRSWNMGIGVRSDYLKADEALALAEKARGAWTNEAKTEIDEALAQLDNAPHCIVEPNQAAVILTHIEKEKASPWMLKIIADAFQQPYKPDNAEQLREVIQAGDVLGAWLSAGLDDPNVCNDMKDAINKWFDAFSTMQNMIEG